MTITLPPPATRAPAHEIVAVAGRAPSVHNTQPWAWRAAGDSLELFAVRSRRLDLADPGGRNLTISCGAALHHAQVAARALGWSASVTRLPDARRPDLLARLDLTRCQRTAGDLSLLQLTAERRTDRRRFTSWPVHPDRLARLRVAGTTWGAWVRVLDDLVSRYRVEHLMSRAFLTQRADPDLRSEHERWLTEARSDTRADGVPATLVPAADTDDPARRPRFEHGELEEAGRQVESSDGLLLLSTPEDRVADWLRAGESLSALWLAAVHEGLSVVPLSQVVEVDETRAELRAQVLGGSAHPQLLLRVGWQAIGRAGLPASPRRPVEDVLTVVS